MSDNGALATGSRNLCDDMWDSDSDESTCGFDKDAEGNKIWDSQVQTCHLNLIKKEEEAYPNFCSMKQPEVFVRVKCLAQEHNAMSPARSRTRTARSGGERTDHEATALPAHSREV